MATNTLRRDRKTPGVYVTEFSAFPPSVVGVETAIPIFIGYTQFAQDPSSGKQMYLQAVPISSMADYYNYFGYGFDSSWTVAPKPVATPAGEYDFQAPTSDGTESGTTIGSYIVAPAGTAQFNLYNAMQLFYANGGGNCFVISVANYFGQTTVPDLGQEPAMVDKAHLLAGIEVANDVRGGTMLVIPDACLMVTATTVADVTTYTYPDYGEVVREMLKQASTLQDRVAILDMPGALLPANWTRGEMKKEADAFYTEISAAADSFSYGVAYGPAVESSLLSVDDVLYTSLNGDPASSTLMNNLLTTQALALYPIETDEDGNEVYPPKFQEVAAHIAAAFPSTTATPNATILPNGITGVTTAGTLNVSMADDALFPPPAEPDLVKKVKSLDNYLINAVPLFGSIQQILAGKLNVAPPSGIMAGVWTRNDLTRGVWNAPANLSLSDVIAPMVVLNDKDQGDYNMPLNGNAIDILRALVNRGTVVWGARTLDGNSLDYRYVQVRRTLIYIEQSIKRALQQFVFAANDGGTWATVTATISNFLTQLWQAGGLMGDKASEAFSVKCGVPTTMSGLDVLNGYMIVNVTVQMIHPAEFIELTFMQTMQGV